MSLLEKRYRHVLRLLPASYRAERQEEMVNTFLEGAGDLTDADNPRPRWSEILSVAALSVRARLGGAGTGPRSFAWGQAVRLVALLGLAFHAMMSWMVFWRFLARYGLFGPSAAPQPALPAPESADRLWDIAQGFTALLWVAAFAALTRGCPRAAKPLALLAVAAASSDLLKLWSLDTRTAVTVMTLNGVLYAVPVLALFAGFHRDAPAIRRPPRVAVLPVAAGVLLSGLLTLAGTWSQQPPISLATWSWIWPWLDLPGLASLALLLAGAASIGVHLLVPARRSPVPAVALAILAVPVMLGRLVRLELGVADPVSRVMTAVGIAQIAALLLCALTLAVLGIRTMPPAPSPGAGPSSC
ncbi:hypothetical protein Sme01_17960 [Sphaerisporangium melleum]|uniref:Uncharacterized protein n=1 Tax=Sphaerisporangium melleum TaxID=321316 RepID=A0A917R1K9_9ACTN|nr:hypothetical protein [Sphaerisporangium melleum]GGK83850.1 hypothetical protein GCM10007964_27900 [Sphaerisporangium melleum]GII69320.1 hypothetical protein Sme01_17960 [Sphaerisporangium melleum]